MLSTTNRFTIEASRFTSKYPLEDIIDPSVLVLGSVAGRSSSSIQTCVGFIVICRFARCRYHSSFSYNRNNFRNISPNSLVTACGNDFTIKHSLRVTNFARKSRSNHSSSKKNRGWPSPNVQQRFKAFDEIHFSIGRQLLKPSVFKERPQVHHNNQLLFQWRTTPPSSRKTLTNDGLVDVIDEKVQELVCILLHVVVKFHWNH